MYYIMSDIHGKQNKFIEMLKLINFNKEDNLLILGDVIDRGESSISLLQYIMNSPNIELLLGNHEEMMIQALVSEDKGHYMCWMNNGGVSTLKQYDNLSPAKQYDILEYLQNCKLCKIINNFIFVHAGIDASWYDPNKHNIVDYMGEQFKETLLWEREMSCSDGIDGYTIIFGHTPTNNLQPIEPMKFWHDTDKIGIDCGACFKDGQLGCLRLDDMKEFYV